MTDKNFDLEKLAELYPDAAKELLSYTQALDSKLLQKEGGDDFITYIKPVSYTHLRAHET